MKVSHSIVQFDDSEHSRSRSSSSKTFQPWKSSSVTKLKNEERLVLMYSDGNVRMAGV